MQTFYDNYDNMINADQLVAIKMGGGGDIEFILFWILFAIMSYLCASCSKIWIESENFNDQAFQFNVC
mgnify:FL=1